MDILPVIVIIVTHIILCIILLVLSVKGKVILRKENIIPIILVPIFTPLAVILIEWIKRSGKHERKLDDFQQQPLEDDILWNTVKNPQEVGNIIPLEEALLINENEIKRKMLLNALYDDPLKYMDVLFVASHNSDVETAHYATTAISHAQRKFQLEIQRKRSAVEENPEDQEILDEYIALLEKYISSGLLEEYLLHNQRLAYAEALNKKLAHESKDKSTLIKKLRYSVLLNDFEDAFEISEKLKKLWPGDEDVWVEALRVCVESKDRKQLQAVVDEILRTPIHWTKQGKEIVDLWIEGAR